MILSIYIYLEIIEILPKNESLSGGELVRLLILTNPPSEKYE